MGAVLPAYVLPVNQPKVGLVDQRTRLQGVPGALVAKVMVRQAVQLLIDQWGQFFECRLVALTPGDEQLGDLFRRACGHTDFPESSSISTIFLCRYSLARARKH